MSRKKRVLIDKFANKNTIERKKCLPKRHCIIQSTNFSRQINLCARTRCIRKRPISISIAHPRNVGFHQIIFDQIHHTAIGIGEHHHFPFRCKREIGMQMGDIFLAIQF